MTEHPHQDIFDEIPGHPPTDQCPIDECMVCGARDCPRREPGHYWKDGCPETPPSWPEQHHVTGER